MGTYERHGHEILECEQVVTATQTAVVRHHHTLYAHLKLTTASQVVAGTDLVVAVELVTWDTGEPVTDMDRQVLVLVDGAQVDEVALVAGQAEVVLQFADTGTYVVGVQADLVQAAEAEVTVS